MLSRNNPARPVHPPQPSQPASPARRAAPLLMRLLFIAAIVALAGFRFTTLLAQPLAVGPCTNPYTVQPGDWIFKIAAACGVSAQDLIAANSLADPNQIQPGQQLVLPGASAPAVADVPSGEAAAVQSAPADVQTVAVAAAAPAQPQPSEAGSFTFGALADAFVDAEHPAEAFGGAVILRTGGQGQSSYLTFDIALADGAAVTGASLRVFAHGSSPDGFAVHAVGADWSEAGLTHASAPGLGSLLGASGPHGGARYVEVNLGGYVAGSGRYSLALVPLGSKPVAYSSREAGANVPEIVVVTGAGVPVPPQPTAVPPQPTAVPPQPTAVPPQPTAVPPVEPPSTGNPLACDVTNIAWSAEGQLLRGGRPDAGDLACLAAAGVDVLVDQRAPGELDYDEAAAAAALGIEYVNLGIPDDTAPSPAVVRAWLDTVNSRLAEGKIVLVHDRAGRGRMGFWDAVFAMHRGASGQQAIEDRYIGRAYPFSGAKIGCGDGGNGQVQALAEISAAFTGTAYTPSVDEHGTRWANCARPGYMAGWDYAAVLP
jgi:hypothetical protein